MTRKITQSGQILIVLVLILLTILTVGLIIIQRSTVDVTTSSQVDQSSRAFSAAEAGIEQALQSNSSTVSVNSGPLTNSSEYTVTTSARLPIAGQALEYPNNDKGGNQGEPAQFWLVDPNTNFSTTNPTPYYTSPNIYVYFGSSTATSTNMPAIEINLIKFDTATKAFSSARAYVDTTTRTPDNGFLKCTSGDPNLTLIPSSPINTSASPNGVGTNDRSFLCRARVATGIGGTSVPIMIRTRLLYVNDQPIAVGPDAAGYSLPPQMSIYTSIGTSGQSRKTIQALKVDSVVPYFLDYAIYSVADIVKTN